VREAPIMMAVSMMMMLMETFSRPPARMLSLIAPSAVEGAVGLGL